MRLLHTLAPLPAQRRPHHRRWLCVACLTLALGAACALVNAGFSDTFVDIEELCAAVDEQIVQAGECQQVGLELATDCTWKYECLREHKGQCNKQWAELVQCTFAEHSCDALDRRPAFPGALGPPFCPEPYAALVKCIGLDKLESTCSEAVGGSCGDGRCDLYRGDPQDCPRDCPLLCEDTRLGFCAARYYEPVCPEMCHPCTIDGVCDPYTENAGHCPEDCPCNDNRVCDPFESIVACPTECRCDYDGSCDPGENAFGCTDCPTCRDSGSCAPFLSNCDDDMDCAIPLKCYYQTCSLPCDPPMRCPPGLICQDLRKVCVSQ